MPLGELPEIYHIIGVSVGLNEIYKHVAAETIHSSSTSSEGCGAEDFVFCTFFQIFTAGLSFCFFPSRS